MKFKLADIQNYTQSAPEHSEKNFQIVFSAVGNRRIEPEVKAVVQRLARQRKNSPCLLWFIGQSTVESRGYLQKVYKKTGKRGRPPLEIVGKQVALVWVIVRMSRGNRSIFSQRPILNGAFFKVPTMTMNFE